jgi:hypothetical protein
MDDAKRGGTTAWRGTLAVLLACLGAGAARAQQVDLTAGISSSLVSRGLLLGRDEPSLQASAAYYAPGGGYVGLSAATLRFYGEAHRAVQLAAKAGWLFPVAGDWMGHVAVQHLAYPFDPGWNGFAYDEATVGLANADIAAASLSVLHHGDDYAAGSRTSAAADVVARYPLPRGFALTAGLGVHDLHRRYGYRYAYGHAGIGWRMGRASIDLAYTFTDAAAKAQLGDRAADRWTGTVLWRF